jgi:hypothetical protein
VEIGQEGVAAVADPPDGPTEAVCRPDNQHNMERACVS